MHHWWEGIKKNPVARHLMNTYIISLFSSNITIRWKFIKDCVQLSDHQYKDENFFGTNKAFFRK